MEENKNIDANEASTSENVQENAVTQSENAAEQVQTTNSVKHRKNGRNRSASSNGTKQNSGEADSCGELEDVANFKEKLSGSNISGYGADGEAVERKFSGERRDRFNRRDRKSESFSNEGEKSESENSNENVESSEEQTPARDGPAFETKAPDNCAMEVKLHDHRIRNNNQNKSEEGVVSYSAAESNCPPVSLFSRIKNAIASLFGRKDSKKKRFSNSKKNFKGNRDGKKFYHNDKKHFDKNRRGGGKFNNKNRNWRPRDRNQTHEGSQQSKAD